MMPTSWKVECLGEIADISSGGTPRRDNSDYWDGDIPWITTSQVDFCTIDHADQHITQAGLKNSAAKLLPAGTLLMALYGQGKTRGKVAKLGITAATNQACAAISIRPGTDENYVFHFLESRYEQIRNASNGGSQDNLSGLIVKKLPITLPSLEEQRGIASALSDMDALLAKLDQLIAKKRDIKQAAMQELLTGHSKARTAGTLRDVVADLEAGVSVNSIDHENPGSTGQPCILKTSAIYDGEFNPAECKLIDAQDTARARLSPRKDTILVSRMNTPNLVGEVGYVANDHPNLYLPDRLWMTRFRQGAKVCPRWLAYMLSSTHIKDKIKGLATGTSGSMKNISKGALLGLELAFPVLEEQIEIAMILSNIDTEITALESRQEKTRLIKQGMMQELLSGRGRLSYSKI